MYIFMYNAFMRALSFVTSEEALTAVAQTVRDVRLLRNWTQRELADRSGVSYSTLRRLEDGESIRLADTFRVLEVLGLLGPLVAAVEEVRDRARRDALAYEPEVAERKRAYPSRRDRNDG